MTVVFIPSISCNCHINARKFTHCSFNFTKLISYSIRVYKGVGADGKQLKPWTTTFEVKPTWSEKSARKKAEDFAAVFEKECKKGVTTDSRQKFAAYCDYVIGLKENRGGKHRTATRYRELTERIYPAIGHIKLRDLRVDHLNDFYTELGKEGVRKGRKSATAKIDIVALRKERGLTCVKISELAGIDARKVSDIVNGKTVCVEDAAAVSAALGLKLEKAFTVTENNRPLSATTIIKYHRLISAVLSQAEKEGLVPVNVASKAIPPSIQKTEVNYFQLEDIEKIQEALETEPIKWQTLVHMLLITGARRGEVLGLKWDKVDFEDCKIHICNNILYSSDRGVYEDTPKTTTSNRFVKLPAETMKLLRRYRAWQAEERLKKGAYYENQDFVFAQDNGKPMHPDSVTMWLDRFSKRHGLPHINPHAFRHTMASMLYFNGVDSVSISKRLGHAQVSTTANIYAHVMEEADQKNADVLADIYLRKA